MKGSNGLATALGLSLSNSVAAVYTNSTSSCVRESVSLFFLPRLYILIIY